MKYKVFTLLFCMIFVGLKASEENGQTSVTDIKPYLMSKLNSTVSYIHEWNKHYRPGYYAIFPVFIASGVVKGVLSPITGSYQTIEDILGCIQCASFGDEDQCAFVDIGYVIGWLADICLALGIIHEIVGRIKGRCGFGKLVAGHVAGGPGQFAGAGHRLVAGN